MTKFILKLASKHGGSTRVAAVLHDVVAYHDGDRAWFDTLRSAKLTTWGARHPDPAVAVATLCYNAGLSILNMNAIFTKETSP